MYKSDFLNEIDSLGLITWTPTEGVQGQTSMVAIAVWDIENPVSIDIPFLL